jgi:hypothetical protein
VYANVSNIIAVQGNVGNTRFIGGNVEISGQVNALGNVVGNFFIGNGSQLTGMDAALPSVISADIRGNIIGAYANVSNIIAVQGNVGNTRFLGGNVAVSGQVNVTGNVIGQHLFGNSVTAPVLRVDDTFYLQLQSNNSILAFDSYDYFEYVRSSNRLDLNMSGNSVARFDSQGNLNVLGNVIAPFFVGNGSQLTGISDSALPGIITADISGNLIGVYANVSNIIAVEGNVGNTRFLGGNVAVSGQVNVLGNVVAPFFVGNGSQLTGIAASALPGVITADIIGNIIGVYANVSNIIAVQGNVGNTRFIGGNVEISGQVNALGNVVGNFFIGNGSQLTGIAASALPGVITADIIGNIIGVYANVSNIIAVQGNVGNTRFLGGNVAVSGQVNALGNVVGNFFIGNGSQLTGIAGALPGVISEDIIGNIIGSYANVSNIIAVQGNVGNTRFLGGNVAVSGQVNALGNVVGNFFIGNGSQLTGIAGALPGVISEDIIGNIIGAYANVTTVIGTTGNIGNIRLDTNIVTAPSYKIIDDFYITTLSGPTPVINFDADDSIQYDRTNNAYTFLSGGVIRTTIDARGNLTASRNIFGKDGIFTGNVTASDNLVGGNTLTIACSNDVGNIFAIQNAAAGAQTFDFINCSSDAAAVRRFSVNGLGAVTAAGNLIARDGIFTGNVIASENLVALKDIFGGNIARITCAANANIMMVNGTTLDNGGKSLIQATTLRGNNAGYSLLRLDNVGGRMLDVDGTGSMFLTSASISDILSVSTRSGALVGNVVTINVPKLSFTDYNFITCRNSNGILFSVDGRGMLTAQCAVNGNVVNVNSTSATNTNDMIRIQSSASAAQPFNMISAKNATGNVFRVNGAGGVFGVGSFNTSGADYAEMFEWEDGNKLDEDRRGITVVLGNSGMIHMANQNDNPVDVIGVVSVNPSVIGDTKWNEWSGRYLRDKFGTKLSNTVYYLSNVSNEAETVRCGINDNPPDGYEKIISSEFIENPKYNPADKYIARGDRSEWSPIGLMGKLRVLPDQIVNPGWKLLRTIKHVDGNTLEYLVK